MDAFLKILSVLADVLFKNSVCLLWSVSKINPDNFNNTILDVMHCLVYQQETEMYHQDWLQLNQITEIREYLDNEVNEIKYRLFIPQLMRKSGWYFFIDRLSGKIDYIGVGGTYLTYNNKSSIYQRIQKHFHLNLESCFPRECFKEKKGIKVINSQQAMRFRKDWVKTLQETYDVLVISAHDKEIDEDRLYIVESFLIGIFQPRYNRQ